MKTRFVRRLLLLMSAVLLMLIFSFVISRVFPGEKLDVGQHNPQGLPVNVEAQRQIREKAYRLLGYDKPLFISHLILSWCRIHLPESQILFGGMR